MKLYLINTNENYYSTTIAYFLDKQKAENYVKKYNEINIENGVHIRTRDLSDTYEWIKEYSAYYCPNYEEFRDEMLADKDNIWIDDNIFVNINEQFYNAQEAKNRANIYNEFGRNHYAPISYVSTVSIEHAATRFKTIINKLEEINFDRTNLREEMISIGFCQAENDTVLYFDQD